MEIAEYLRQNKHYDTIVTTQEPKGVCQLAQIFAKENSMILELHFLNIKKYAKGAFEHRSDNVIKSSDFLLLIHDGESKGTQNELERVKKFKKPYKYVMLDKTDELQNTEKSDILNKEKKIDSDDIIGLDDDLDLMDFNFK
jgi:uncharacterized phage-like protein YoqJ